MYKYNLNMNWSFNLTSVFLIDEWTRLSLNVVALCVQSHPPPATYQFIITDATRRPTIGDLTNEAARVQDPFLSKKTAKSTAEQVQTLRSSAEKRRRKKLQKQSEHSPMTTEIGDEILPPALEADAEQPPLFDGTTRLYVSYTCPFAQRVWITRNYKGLQEKIKLVGLNLQNRPTWYKEKVYPQNKVPALEHNGKVIGESLDLIKYVDSNFEGPSLFPDDPAKRQYGEELLTYTDTFTREVFTSFKGDPAKQAGAQFDYLENALHKFDDGPFFLGQFSLVDIAYVPFVERFQIFLAEVFKYDITEGRPKLAAWIEEINKIDAYKQTKKTDPKELVEHYKKRLLA